MQAWLFKMLINRTPKREIETVNMIKGNAQKQICMQQKLGDHAMQKHQQISQKQ